MKNVKKNTTVIVLCKWGIFTVDPLTNFYVDWEQIRTFINNEQYIVSIWLFRNIDKMIKKTTVLFKPHGIQNLKDIKALIKKLEQVKDITISDEKKQEIIDASKNMLNKKEHIFYKTNIE